MKKLTVLASAIAVCVVIWMNWRPTLRNLDDVRLGMTETEVESLIGKPNGYMCGPMHSSHAGFGRIYVTSEGTMYIQYDSAGRVVSVGRHLTDLEGVGPTASGKE